jgi:hypothetical protein
MPPRAVIFDLGGVVTGSPGLTGPGALRGSCPEAPETGPVDRPERQHTPLAPPSSGASGSSTTWSASLEALSMRSCSVRSPTTRIWALLDAGRPSWDVPPPSHPLNSEEPGSDVQVPDPVTPVLISVARRPLYAPGGGHVASRPERVARSGRRTRWRRSAVENVEVAVATMPRMSRRVPLASVVGPATESFLRRSTVERRRSSRQSRPRHTA